jgi:glycosyltransferase involved in cell wall biosynthesis
MATLPYYALSPSTALSILGFLHGPDRTIPTPAENWRDARVDLIIPALNEASHIALCLASVMRQTLRPRQIFLIDDGSTDNTIEIARAFCAANGVELTAVRRRLPIGKTPTLKRQARELDSDVEFILDGDTVLESERYIERVVQELYQAAGIACACGTILPQRQVDRQRWLDAPEVRHFTDAHPAFRPAADRPVVAAARGLTNAYRDVLYSFLQRFVYRGQVVFLGTITNPVGCAVAYRRKYIKELFDHFGPIFGDDLTNSEDIFIGLAMLDIGYRNVQVPDVLARTVEPPIYRLPQQMYLWSSAFLQSCYYFDPLLRSPLKALRRWLSRGRGAPGQGGQSRAHRSSSLGGTLLSSALHLAVASPAPPLQGPLLRVRHTNHVAAQDTPAWGTLQGRERRLIAEPYRQRFGRDWTTEYGRPAGWMLLVEAIEKVFFPTTILILIILGAWRGLAMTVAIETSIGLCVLAGVMKGHRVAYVLKGLVMTPLRYMAVAADAATIALFAWHIWVTKRRNWRK